MPHIYHFLLDGRMSGQLVYVESLGAAMAGRYVWEIVVAGAVGSGPISLFNLRTLWRPLYLLEIPLNVLRIIWLTKRRKLRSGRAVFHVHGAPSIAPIAAARILGMPVVWHIHETMAEYRPFAQVCRALLRRHPHRVVVDAERARDIFDVPDAVHVPSPVDTTYWSRAGAAASRVEPVRRPRGGPLRIVAVGNLNPVKGFDLLLEALRGVQGPWRLDLVGARLDSHAEYGAALHRAAAALRSEGESQDAVLHGSVERDTIRRLLFECDVFVLPSRSEACPIALLEALAMNCLCIAADVGDVRRMAPPAMAALLFPAGDVVALRERLVQVVAMSRDQRELIAAGAAARIEREFSVNRIADRLGRVYVEILNSGPTIPVRDSVLVPTVNDEAVRRRDHR